MPVQVPQISIEQSIPEELQYFLFRQLFAVGQVGF